VEGAVERELHKEHLVVVVGDGQCRITDTTTGTQTDISHLHEALEHSRAEILVGHLLELVDVEIDVGILQVEEADGCVDENDSEHEKRGH